MNGEKLVQNIKSIAVAKGIKMMDLYQQAGFTSGAMSQWKMGLTNPQMSTLTRIANVLGVTLNELLEGTEEEPASVSADGPKINPRYFDLSPDDQATVDALIDRLAKGGQ